MLKNLMTKALSFLIPAMLLATCAAEAAAPGDENWVAGFNTPGMNGLVYALAIDNSGNLYAAGQFTMAGGLAANSIVKWNGSAWAVLGLGIDGSVSTMACDNAGNLYVAGWFYTAGGAAANNIAKWDGSEWSAMGSGFDESNSVSALACDSAGNLYAGGFFATAGGVNAANIAKWNGSEWSALRPGSRIEEKWSEVSTLACDSAGNLYVGYDTSERDNPVATYICKWDGSSWSDLGSGFIGADSSISVLACDSSDNLYAGGSFTKAGFVKANNIAKWNGKVWAPLGSGVDCWVGALAFDSAGNLYAGGNFITASGVTANNIAMWNGSSWSALGSGMTGNYNGLDSYVNALACDSAGNLYAGGVFLMAGGVPVTNIAEWNGASWSEMEFLSGSGINGTVPALAFDSAGNLYAGGNFTMAGGVAVNNIAMWNGSVWSPMGSGRINDINVLASDGAGNIYAGGDFSTAGGVTVNNIAKWNGSA